MPAMASAHPAGGQPIARTWTLRFDDDDALVRWEVRLPPSERDVTADELSSALLVSFDGGEPQRLVRADAPGGQSYGFELTVPGPVQQIHLEDGALPDHVSLTRFDLEAHGTQVVDHSASLFPGRDGIVADRTGTWLSTEATRTVDVTLRSATGWETLWLDSAPRVGLAARAPHAPMTPLVGLGLAAIALSAIRGARRWKAPPAPPPQPGRG